jgi:hypothetical protein
MFKVLHKEHGKGGGMKFLGGAALVLFFSVLFMSPDLKAQIRPAEFRFRTQNHIDRLVVLGEALQEQFPEDFGHLKPEIVKEYLSKYHDAPKIMSLMELRNHGYRGARSVSEVLASFFGVNRRLNTLTSSDREILNATIDELNSIEGRLKRTFFQANRLSPAEIRSLMLLERVVDLTDTGIARWMELGVSREEALASTYVSQTQGQEHVLRLILWLEGHYDMVLYGGSMNSCQNILQAVAP